ncbi:MAG: response regulator [Spirochaetes bacterium]|nr:response regulator [Spirochaetota bacterium]
MKDKSTLLIVDDEEVVLSGLSEMLADFNYNILTASNGEVALDILSTEEVDLIIADINMPHIDGKKILTAVKEIEPDTPIILITGIDIEKGKEFAEKNKADGFLEKPFHLDDIRPMIENSLKNKK